MLKNKIIEYSKSIGIDKIGFTSGKSFPRLVTQLIQQHKQGFSSGLERGTIDQRTDPSQSLADVKTIISVAVSYPHKMINRPKGSKTNPRGVFSRSSWGLDYHIYLLGKLELLARFIRDQDKEARFLPMVDTGFLVDRAVAQRAGIGWIGKNCSLITEEYGSYVYLGELLTTVKLETDEEIEGKCGTCTKCLDACPTKAFIAPGVLDSKRCLSYLTQTKSDVPVKFRKKFGNRLYGCDTCQVVCPCNKGKKPSFHPELQPFGEHEMPLLIPLLSMNNSQFKNIYSRMAGGWRGRTPIQRNAIFALAFFKTPEGIPVLEKLLTDQRQVIRETAKWALLEIKSKHQ